MKSARKWISLMLVVVCVVGILSGCATANAPETNKTRTVVDMSGHSVEVPEKVNSYISLWVGSVTITLMLDHGEKMVGCSETAASYPLFDRACQNPEDITYFTNDAITLEGILETGAEVVFYRGKDNADLAEKLIKAGVAAIDVEFNTYDEMMDAIDIMADVLNTDYACGIASRYRTYANEMIEKAQAVGNTVQDRKSIIVIRDTSNLRAYGVNRFAGRWATLCGGDYALKDGDPNGYVNLTSEQLLEYDPEIIVFVIPGEAKKFIEDAKWSSLTAVKNGHVYENPSAIGTWSNHGSECVLQFGWAIEKLYPECTDFDFVKKVRDFYKEFYAMELTDAEITSIINAGK